VTGWTALLERARGCFRAPSFELFAELLFGWVCAPGRRTITAMIAVADPAGRRAHDAYHRFMRDGAWSMRALWRVLAGYAIARFAPTGVVSLDVDDTLFHKAGRQVEGAGVFRDAVRSTVRRVVYALGLNLVVLTLRVSPPWGGRPIALPVNARLHRKNDLTSTVEHAAAMVRELTEWLPEREFHLCGDGAYASLCGADLPRTSLSICLCKWIGQVVGLSPPLIVFHRLSVSTSYVLAALRALHVDASGAARRDGCGRRNSRDVLMPGAQRAGRDRPGRARPGRPSSPARPRPRPAGRAPCAGCGPRPVPWPGPGRVCLRCRGWPATTA
jgi:hypothetical protein